MKRTPVIYARWKTVNSGTRNHKAKPQSRMSMRCSLRLMMQKCRMTSPLQQALCFRSLIMSWQIYWVMVVSFSSYWMSCMINWRLTQPWSQRARWSWIRNWMRLKCWSSSWGQLSPGLKNVNCSPSTTRGRLSCGVCKARARLDLI